MTAYFPDQSDFYTLVFFHSEISVPGWYFLSSVVHNPKPVTKKEKKSKLLKLREINLMAKRISFQREIIVAACQPCEGTRPLMEKHKVAGLLSLTGYLARRRACYQA
jgi:hypothetical protein